MENLKEYKITRGQNNPLVEAYYNGLSDAKKQIFDEFDKLSLRMLHDVDKAYHRIELQNETINLLKKKIDNIKKAESKSLNEVKKMKAEISEQINAFIKSQQNQSFYSYLKSKVWNIGTIRKQ